MQQIKKEPKKLSPLKHPMEESKTAEKKSDSSCTPASCSQNKNCTAQITIKQDVGYGNALFIRGDGANLSWDKGIPLKNVKPNEWVWEGTGTFTRCEFKILLNDTIYETGPNHIITYGSTLQYTPNFP